MASLKEKRAALVKQLEEKQGLLAAGKADGDTIAFVKSALAEVEGIDRQLDGMKQSDDLLAQIAQRSVEQRLEVVDVAPHECDVDRVGYVRNHRIPPREDRKAAEVVRCRMLPVYRRIVQDVDAVDQTEGLAVAGRQRQIDLRAAVALDHVEIVEDRRLEDQRRSIFQIAQLTVYVEFLRHSVKCFIESSTTQSCMQAFVREMSPSST